MKDFEESGDRGGFFRNFSHHRAGRGDISPIILRLLREKPMHGYEIIRTLEERSHGFWRPSAGSIYPILQLLEEQELVSSHEMGGKKIYSLTEAGEKEANKGNQWERWEHRAKAGQSFAEMRHIIQEIAISLKDIALEGTPEDVAEIRTILTETRDRCAELARKQR